MLLTQKAAAHRAIPGHVRPPHAFSLKVGLLHLAEASELSVYNLESRVGKQQHNADPGAGNRAISV